MQSKVPSRATQTTPKVDKKTAVSSNLSANNRCQPSQKKSCQKNPNGSLRAGRNAENIYVNTTDENNTVDHNNGQYMASSLVNDWQLKQNRKLLSQGQEANQNERVQDVHIEDVDDASDINPLNRTNQHNQYHEKLIKLTELKDGQKKNQFS